MVEEERAAQSGTVPASPQEEHTDLNPQQDKRNWDGAHVRSTLSEIIVLRVSCCLFCCHHSGIVCSKRRRITSDLQLLCSGKIVRNGLP